MISNTLTQKKSIMSTTIATHILVFPYPAHGHLPALLDLTHQLALRGLKITILVTPKNLPSLTPLLSAHPTSIKTLVLPFPPHPRLLSGVENVKDIGNSGNAPIISSLSKLKDEVIAWFRSHPSPPQAIISDFFLGFTQHWATQLNIPRLAFFSVSSFLTCILKHLWENLETRSNCDVIEFLELPRTPCLKIDQLPSIYKKFKEGDPDWEAVKESLVMNSKSWGYVYNSFYELEGEFLDHVPKILGHGRVYTVGPLSTIKRVNPDSDTTYGLFKWLDTCPDDSVVYVCFGSQTLLTEPQIKALASALERSKTRFIWVIKSINIEQIPSGFEEQVSDRGIVIRGWAPQVEILNHKAVGGFVNHCGWNSMFESLMAGVMLLVWPMEADQFVNGKIVVEFKGIAVKLCEGEYTIPDSDELAQTIKESFGHDVPQKVKAKEMREKALEGMKVGGRSSVRIDELVEDLRQIKYTKYDMEQC